MAGVFRLTAIYSHFSISSMRQARGPKNTKESKDMSAVRELRRRITSIKNIAKMTRAMQMVASSKMRKAQERIQHSRPYAEHLRLLVERLTNTIEDTEDASLALLQHRPMRHICLIPVTPDRTLCGA